MVNKRQEFKIDIPEITMTATTISADIPYISLQFVQDAGKQTAAQAAGLAQSAQDAAVQKQIAFKERLRTLVAPLMIHMFNCYRETISSARTQASSRFDEQIAKLSAAVTTLIASSVPKDDESLVSARASLADVVAKRAAVIAPFDEALSKLEVSINSSLDQFLGRGPGGALAAFGGGYAATRGGLMTWSAAAAPLAGPDDNGLAPSTTVGLIRFQPPVA